MAKSRQSDIEPIPKDLFDVLACPLCKSGLEYTKDKKDLICPNCSTKYPIEDGIPVLMPPKESNRQ